ncbi:MAG: hypothetical protein ACOYMR_17280 [Ilumatobacteraceae bacterium]
MSVRTPEEIEWSTALDEYEAMLRHHVQRLEHPDGEPGEMPTLRTPTAPMPASLVARALDLLDRTGELEVAARALQMQVQLELVPRRAPVAADTLPTLLDRRL